MPLYSAELGRKLESTNCEVGNTDKQSNAHLGLEPLLSKPSNFWNLRGEVADPWDSSLFSDGDEPVDELKSQRHYKFMSEKVFERQLTDNDDHGDVES